MLFVLLESDDQKIQYLKLVKILNKEADRLTQHVSTPKSSQKTFFG